MGEVGGRGWAKATTNQRAWGIGRQEWGGVGGSGGKGKNEFVSDTNSSDTNSFCPGAAAGRGVVWGRRAILAQGTCYV